MAIGVFQAGTDPNDFEAGPGSTIALTGRFAAAPINEDGGERLVHLGLALSERFPEHGVIDVSQQPQTPLLGLGDTAFSPFVPQIRIPASFQQLGNLQFAAVRGPSWTQAEWYGSWVDQLGGGPVFFHGCHIDCGYFLTGEHRPYQNASGAFGAVRVNRPWLRCRADHDRELGWGAWELTARFAYLDFQDADTPRGPGGQLIGLRMPESTFGANWYLSDHVRLMFNYSYAVPEEPNTGTSVANIFSTRLGVFW
jgi:phosphate-selective porin OprO/OprP